MLIGDTRTGFTTLRLAITGEYEKDKINDGFYPAIALAELTDRSAS